MTTDWPISVSNSEIQTFTECRRRWYLSYYRRLQPKIQQFSGPLALGSRVHRALELYYNSGQGSGTLLTHWTKLVAEDRAIVQAEGRDEADFDNEAELGRIMLEGYLQWNDEEGIDSDLEIISSEEMLSMPMLDGRVNLVGKVDQRVRRKSDGTRWVRDFKTAANLAEYDKTAFMSEQLLTYMTIEASHRDEEDRVGGGVFTLLKKVKRTASARPPFYREVEVRHNIFTLRNFWSRLNGKIHDLATVRQALDEGADHHVVAYPRPSRDCSWKCSFYAQCYMFDDGSAVEQSLHDNFDIKSPYAYYGDDDPMK